MSQILLYCKLHGHYNIHLLTEQRWVPNLPFCCLRNNSVIASPQIMYSISEDVVSSIVIPAKLCKATEAVVLLSALVSQSLGPGRPSRLACRRLSRKASTEAQQASIN